MHLETKDIHNRFVSALSPAFETGLGNSKHSTSIC